MEGNYETRNEQETEELGFKFGTTLNGGEIVLFRAPMGAGKTHFTKGLLEGLDFDGDEVTSPSFSLVNRYDARLRVYHIDLWRLAEGASASFAVGLDEIFEERDAVVVIEWSERISFADLPRDAVIIEIEILDGDRRFIKIYGSEMPAANPV
ncbi:MAG: tRNA (adenosine(37)-N6)-threonylcarbamoyltransferase complex ATPase subunit type 1 TsaE [Pyrinomonadaceae bacterium]